MARRCAGASNMSAEKGNVIERSWESRELGGKQLVPWMTKEHPPPGLANAPLRCHSLISLLAVNNVMFAVLANCSLVISRSTPSGRFLPIPAG